MAAAALALLLALLPGIGSSTEARQFVQAFYNWYIPIVLGSHAESYVELATAGRPRVFTDELLRSLKSDVAAQKGADEIVAVSGSFDPFTASQDPCERYEAGRVAVDGARYLVDVAAVCDGKKSAGPAVVIELARTNGRWQIANVRFPDGDNLLATIKRFQEDRDRSRSRK